MNEINQLACLERKRSLRSYESPLNCLKKRRMEKKSHVTPEKLDKQTAVDSLSKQSSRNSVIVITDSDNEVNSRNEEVVSLSDSIECSFLQRKSEKKLKSCKQKNSRPSVMIIENESSTVDDNTQESSSNGENIEPLQVDEVVELWSSLKSRQKQKHHGKIIKRYFFKPHKNKKKAYLEDTRPNYAYLELLANKTAVHTRQKKLKCNKVSEAASHRNESVIRRSRRLKARDANTRETKKAKCDENLSDLAHDANTRKTKKMKCDENQSSTNSNRKLREIVVDGCNVAFLHTNGREFSEKGIKIVIDYFESRGHVVKVFLPQHIRKRKYLLLEELYKKGIVVFTPSRHIAGKQITSYDDRYILEYATLCKGIVISSDQYRDLYEEKPEWRDTILNRLLTPTFVGDYIMFPEDPLGKSGPNLETFLRH